jgi:LysM repeat protein
MSERVLPVRAFLIHVTHYDPVWQKRKAREKPFDLKVAREVVDAMAEADMNLLVIDLADGVKYRSHPELKRHYSVPMGQLKRLVEHARKRGIEVVPKLNFAQSATQYHDQWLRPYNRRFNSGDYWKVAFELIDEVIGVCKPERFFHVGMDEDMDRSHRQYAEAVRTLAEGLKARGLRAVMWKDIPITCPGIWEAPGEKSRAAERTTPRDVVQVPWGYREANPSLVRHLRRKGFEVWGATGGKPDLVRQWRDAVLRYGGTGIMLTFWRPCRPGNRKGMLDLIRTCGPLCKEG